MGLERNPTTEQVDIARELNLKNPEEYSYGQLAKWIHLARRANLVGIADIQSYSLFDAGNLVRVAEAKKVSEGIAKKLNPGEQYMVAMRKMTDLSELIDFRDSLELFYRLYKMGCFVSFSQLLAQDDQNVFFEAQTEALFAASNIRKGVLQCSVDEKVLWQIKIVKITPNYVSVTRCVDGEDSSEVTRHTKSYFLEKYGLCSKGTIEDSIVCLRYVD